MFFVCRHGERADNGTMAEQEKIEISFDPHLTEIGQKQAKNTGLFIQQKVKEASSNGLLSTPTPKYLILTSPFLRCVQTANHIAKALGPENLFDNAIFLDNSICELLSIGFYEKNVLPELYLRTKPKSDIAKYIDIELKDSLIPGNIVPEYPETHGSFFNRLEFAYRYIKDYLLGEEVYKNVVVILITHGFAVQVVLEIMNEYDYLKEVDYCSTQQIYYPDPVKSKEDYKVLVKQYHEHIYDNKESKIEEIVIGPPKL